MPDLKGNIKGISLAGLTTPWHKYAQSVECKEGVKKAARLFERGDVEGLVSHANRDG